MNQWPTYEQKLAEYWAAYKDKTQSVMIRFFRYLPKSDLTLIVLKGHLLLEESLNELFLRILKLPSAIDDARLTFFQKVCVAQAIMDDVGGHPHFWRSLKRLNAIRNKFAHKLDPSDIQQEVSVFMEDVFEAGGKPSKEVRDEIGANKVELLLKIGIMSVFVGVRALIDGLDAAKYYPMEGEDS